MNNKMTHSIIVNKNGDLTEKKIKNIDKKYTSCNYKTDKDFILLHTYKNINEKFKNIEIEIYGKKKGRANNENKYEFARPIDNELYFGNLLLLKKNVKTDDYDDLFISEWDKIYEALFGGFEDIDKSDDERSVDSEIYDDEEYTSHGYLKDDFIVEDDELEEESYCDEETEETCSFEESDENNTSVELENDSD